MADAPQEKKGEDKRADGSREDLDRFTVLQETSDKNLDADTIPAEEVVTVGEDAFSSGLVNVTLDDNDEAVLESLIAASEIDQDADADSDEQAVLSDDSQSDDVANLEVAPPAAGETPVQSSPIGEGDIQDERPAVEFAAAGAMGSDAEGAVDGALGSDGDLEEPSPASEAEEGALGEDAEASDDEATDDAPPSDDDEAGSGDSDESLGDDDDGSFSPDGGEDDPDGLDSGDGLRLTGSAGDDRLTGGAGDDTVVYEGDSSDYTLSSIGEDGAYRIVGLGNYDIVHGVERFQFSDGIFSAADLLSQDSDAEDDTGGGDDDDRGRGGSDDDGPRAMPMGMMKAMASVMTNASGAARLATMSRMRRTMAMTAMKCSRLTCQR